MFPAKKCIYWCTSNKVPISMQDEDNWIIENANKKAYFGHDLLSLWVSKTAACVCVSVCKFVSVCVSVRNRVHLVFDVLCQGCFGLHSSRALAFLPLCVFIRRTAETLSVCLGCSVQFCHTDTSCIKRHTNLPPTFDVPHAPLPLIASRHTHTQTETRRHPKKS